MLAFANYSLSAKLYFGAVDMCQQIHLSAADCGMPSPSTASIEPAAELSKVYDENFIF